MFEMNWKMGDFENSCIKVKKSKNSVYVQNDEKVKNFQGGLYG